MISQLIELGELNSDGVVLLFHGAMAQYRIISKVQMYDDSAVSTP